MLLRLKSLSQIRTRSQFIQKKFTRPRTFRMASPLKSQARVIPIPVLSDNYAYLVIDQETKHAAIVDAASETKPILDRVEQEGVKATHILTTHHHWDHADGNIDVKSKIPGLIIAGGDDRIPGLTHKLGNKETIKIGNLTVTCFNSPCHTSGHVVYLIDGNLFTGDTLFIGGCGKFFEGTKEQMQYALNELISSFPGETVVWCGHEYTVSNLLFALSVEPNNQALKEKFAWAKEQRAANKFTIPTTVAAEMSYNPFMRVSNKTVKAAVGKETDSDADTMGNLREAKNNFKAPAL